MRKGLSVALMALLILWPTLAQADPPDLDTLKQQRSTLTGQLDVVKGEQATILTDLFNLNRKLDETRQKMSATQMDMAKVEQALAETTRQSLDLKARNEERLQFFGRRVRFMVEHGAATYLEVLFGATNLADFIWRLGIIQAFIRRDALLLTEVRSLRQQVAAKEAELKAEHQQLTDLNQRLVSEQTDLENTIAIKNDKLAALKEHRGQYEQQLDQLERLWNEKALPVLQAFGDAFHTMTLHINDLKPSQFDVSFFPVPSARVTVTTGDLNAFLQQFPELKGLTFALLPGQADLQGDFGGATLEVDGTFAIVGKTVLRYQPAQVSFAGLPVGAEYTRKLIASGGLDLDLNNLIANWKLNSIVIDNGSVTVKASYSP